MSQRVQLIISAANVRFEEDIFYMYGICIFNDIPVRELA